MPDHPHLMFAKALWTVTAEGDAEAVRELLDDDVVWHAGGNHAMSGEFRGPDAVLDYLASVGERTDELRTELLDLYIGERGAIATYHVSARRELKRLETDVFLELEIWEGKLLSARSAAFDQKATNEFWGPPEE